MKKRLHIQLSVLALLLLYAFSNSPLILFHHHDHHEEIVSFEKATACEKSIYYAERGHGCEHGAHVSAASEKCALCDHHTLSPHAFQAVSFCSLKLVGSTKHIERFVPYYFLSPSNSSNRGPPAISSYTL